MTTTDISGSSGFALRVDAGATLSYFDALKRDCPKAIAVALNRTAEDGLAVIRRNVQANFTMRTLPLNFVAPQVLPAAYRAREDKLTATLDTYGAGKILNPFETGQPHGIDRLGRMPAVPGKALRPTKGAIIARQWYPANLGLQPMRDANGSAYYATGKGAKARGLTGPKPMQGKLRTYQIGNRIFRRWGSGKGETELIWTLTPAVRRPAVLHYRDDATATTNSRWPINMRGAWEFYEGLASRRGGR